MRPARTKDDPRTGAARLWRGRGRPEVATLVAVGALLLVSAVLHVWQLDRTGLRGDEAVYAGQAAVLADADGFSRHFMLASRGNSNFLLFQELLSLVYRVVGVGDLAARLVSAVLSTATVLVVFLTGRLLYGRRAGVLAALLLALSSYALSLGRLALLDPLAALLFAVAVLCLAHWDAGRRTAWLVGFAATFSLAVQAKVIGVLLAAVFVLYLLLTRSWRQLTSRTLLLAGAACLVCLLPAALQVLRHGDQLAAFLGTSLNRRSAVPWYYYFGVLRTYDGLMLPLVWLAGFVLAAIRRSRADVLPLLVLVVGGGFLQFYPLKAFNYALVLVPALCLLGGRALAELRVPRAAQVPSWALGTAAAAGLAILAAPHLDAVLHDNTAAGLREASNWLTANAAPGDGVMTLSHGSAQYVFSFYGHHDAYPYGRFQLATVVPGPKVVQPKPDPLGGTPRDWATTQPLRLLQDGTVTYLAYYNNRLAGLTPQMEDHGSEGPLVDTSTQRRFQRLIAAYGGRLVHTVHQGRDPAVWIYQVGHRARPTGSYTVGSEVVHLSALGFQRNSAIDIRYRGKTVGKAHSNDSGALKTSFPLPPGTATRYRLTATDEAGRYLSLIGLPRPSATFVMHRNQLLVHASGFTAGAHVTATYRTRQYATGRADTSGSLSLAFPLPKRTSPRYRLVLADAVGNRVTLTHLPVPTLVASTTAGRVAAFGVGFAPDQRVRITYHGLPVTTARTDAAGNFRVAFAVPRRTRPGYNLRATDVSGYTAITSRLGSAA